jgi:hypothetical protein
VRRVLHLRQHDLPHQLVAVERVQQIVDRSLYASLGLVDLRLQETENASESRNHKRSRCSQVRLEEAGV